MTGTTRVCDFIAISGHLVALMAREVEVRDAMQAHEAERPEHANDHLAKRHPRLVEVLRRNPAANTALVASIRKELIERLREFISTAAHNERTLRSGREANERVIGAIIAAAGDRQACATA